jgi:CheY-like chemotaxis protein
MSACSSAMRVYLVDDDHDTTDCMRLLFKHWGHDVHVANDGALAIEEAPFIRPDLMLVDLGMPQIDGLQVARRLRARAELAETSLVAVTGYADAPHCERALAAGFDECLIKPLPVESMLALLDRVQARIAATRERAALAVEAVVQSRQAVAQDGEVRASVQIGPNQPDLAPPECVAVRLQKSGISDILLLGDEASARRLRDWLRERGCRVGPVFRSDSGDAAFYNYSRRQARRLLRDNSEFRTVG